MKRPCSDQQAFRNSLKTYSKLAVYQDWRSKETSTKSEMITMFDRKAPSRKALAILWPCIRRGSLQTHHITQNYLWRLSRTRFWRTKWASHQSQWYQTLDLGCSSTEVGTKLYLVQTQTTPKLTTFELKGVGADVDIVKIKTELARTGVQVCDVQIKEEVCSQARSGEAEVKIRSHGPLDDLKLKRKLSALGINASQKEQKNHKNR